MKMNMYKRRWDNKFRKWIYEHREVLEIHLGRKLLSSECVHHKDHNHLNNCIDNLEIVTRKEHIKIHKIERKPRICSKCSNNHHAKGLCNNHYMKMLRIKNMKCPAIN